MKIGSTEWDVVKTLKQLSNGSARGIGEKYYQMGIFSKKYYQTEVPEELRRTPSPFLFAGLSSQAIYPPKRFKRCLTRLENYHFFISFKN